MTSTLEDTQARLTIEKMSADGTPIAKVALDPAIFGIAPNVPVMHQVVLAQLAARRAGTQSTKTRAEVSGGSAKPFRQKGTGRARQGSTRAPHWSGGGVALGPKPRSYKQRTPRKMIQLALRSALSDRALDRRVLLVDEWGFTVPKTKEAAAALGALEVGGRVLVVLGREDVVAERSFDNLPNVDLVETAQLTAYDVLCSDFVVFTDATIPGEVALVEKYSDAEKSAKAAAKPAPKAKKAPAAKAKAKAEAADEDEKVETVEADTDVEPEAVAEESAEANAETEDEVTDAAVEAADGDDAEKDEEES
ncbi:MAG TPA: 50S ribosomal protein L4 [Acidimicrobiales bacterium]|nr:50S ribosomal protein L4 [Acidimicrobiales bacterium]